MMKQTIMAVVGLALILGATTTQAQDSQAADSKFWIGVGVGTRIVTGDTPAPRIGETANLLQFGVQGVWGFHPLFGVVADWAYGFRELTYESSATTTVTDTTGASNTTQTTINNKSKSRGWNLNALFAFRLPVGSRGGQLYAGPGLALINQEFRVERTTNDVVEVNEAKMGTNVGLAIGAGAIMPIWLSA